MIWDILSSTHLDIQWIAPSSGWLYMSMQVAVYVRMDLGSAVGNRLAGVWYAGRRSNESLRAAHLPRPSVLNMV